MGNSPSFAQVAASAAPVLKLRGSWTVIDPAIAEKARKRLVRTVKPGQALAATLREKSAGRDDGINGLVAELLKKALV